MKNRSKGILLSYINIFLNMFSGLFMSAFLIRSVGQTDYGIYQSIGSFANYLILLEFGTGTVMTRNVSICRKRGESQQEIEKNVSTLWIITNFLAVFILLVSVVFYISIDTVYAGSFDPEQIAYAKKIFIFITLSLIASFYYQTLQGGILAFEYYTFKSLASISKILVRTVLIVVVVNLSRNILLVAIVDSIISIFLTGYTFYYFRKKCRVRFRPTLFDKTILRSSLPLCFAVFLQGIVNQANNNVDKFVIGIRLTPEDVAVYSVGMFVYSIFSSLTTVPISMYAPQINGSVASGISREDLVGQLVQPCRLVALTGGTILFGFIAVGRQFITIVYGAEYLEAWKIAVIIMTPMLINMSNGVLVNVLDALNKRMVRSAVLILTTVINILLTVFFVDLYGMTGAALATAICTVIGQIIIMNIYYIKKIGINILMLYNRVWKGILPFQVLGCIAAVIAGQWISNEFLTFIIGAVIFFAFFSGGYLLCGCTEEERKLIHKIIHSCRRRSGDK